MRNVFILIDSLFRYSLNRISRYGKSMMCKLALLLNWSDRQRVDIRIWKVSGADSDRWQRLLRQPMMMTNL